MHLGYHFSLCIAYFAVIMMQILRHCLRQPSRSLFRTTVQTPSACAVSLPMLDLTGQSKRFAGHSHWKNIKHIKEAKDAEKQKVTLNTMQRIRVAVRGLPLIVYRENTLKHSCSAWVASLKVKEKLREMHNKFVMLFCSETWAFKIEFMQCTNFSVTYF